MIPEEVEKEILDVDAPAHDGFRAKLPRASVLFGLLAWGIAVFSVFLFKFMTQKSHNSIIDFIFAHYILAPGTILSIAAGLVGLLFALWELKRRARLPLKASVLGLLLNLGLLAAFASQMQIGTSIGDYGFKTANPVFLRLFVTFYGPNAKDCYGRSPLFRAIVFRNRDSAVFLLNHGADVNGDSPSYPVHEAAERDQPELVELFLEHGADPWLKDYSGRSAFDLARSPEVKTVFQKRGIEARKAPPATASPTSIIYTNTQDFLDSLKKDRSTPDNSKGPASTPGR